MVCLMCYFEITPHGFRKSRTYTCRKLLYERYFLPRAFVMYWPGARCDMDFIWAGAHCLRWKPVSSGRMSYQFHTLPVVSAPIWSLS